MSQKPGKTTEEDKKEAQAQEEDEANPDSCRHAYSSDQANPGKLDALDQLVVVFQALCQQYVTLLCLSDSGPDKYAAPVFETELSDRWHRVAMQQAVGIARSWRTNRQVAYDAYLEDVADYARPRQKRKPAACP